MRCGPSHHATAPDSVRVFASRARTRGDGSTRWIDSRTHPAAANPRQEGVRGRPTCRGRSPAAVFPQLSEQHVESRDRRSRWSTLLRQGWRCHPAVSDGVRQYRIAQPFSSAVSGRYNLRHDAVAVRDEYGFSARRQADVFTQLVLEDFQPYRTHPWNVASRSFHVKPDSRPM